MVWKAASQTRFRALKHENGIAGRPTIIVRIIACFQPMQNCQAEYFRHLLKPVTLLFWLDHMALLKPEQNNSLPYFPPQKSTLTSTSVAFPSDLHGLSTGQANADGVFFKRPPPQWNIPYPTGGPYLKNSQFALPHRLGVSDKLIDVSSAPQKKFLIFDQSGNDTRLFFSTSFSPDDQNIAPKIPASANEQILVNEEKWEENHLSDGEGEMLEDSKEINALLYSDSDDEYYDDDDVDDDENNEVTSTRRNEFIIEGGNVKGKLLEEPLEEVASCDGSPKRQRLVDGRYRKSSLVGVGSPVKRVNSSTSSYDDDDDEINSSKRETKVEIREALKIMGSIIPGLKSKNPLSIIEKAIVYLESMKTEAEALGLSCPEGKSVIFP